MTRPAALLPLLALLLAACAAAPRMIVLPSGPRSVESLLAEHRPEVGRNITPFVLERSERTTQQLVFVRDREEPHEHAGQDLIVTVLRGHGTLWLGERQVPMHEGDVAVVPAGLRHWFVNQGDEPAAAFVILAPTTPESVPNP